MYHLVREVLELAYNRLVTRNVSDGTRNITKSVRINSDRVGEGHIIIWTTRNYSVQC